MPEFPNSEGLVAPAVGVEWIAVTTAEWRRIRKVPSQVRCHPACMLRTWSPRSCGEGTSRNCLRSCLRTYVLSLSMFASSALFRGERT
ncbi:hypothetical protein BD310DRAFT_922079 [Dichomitus squalens]|uniref:Uncharacterized protein n=1 Tax=Dichomitus squalens TaxID=114155 RepID=A0A4Q9Q1S5_9APHY|nr:hypothetical protein BD310DRAFT_922079 [Dichomitus squalens]